METKRSMEKRILSILLSMAMIITLLPANFVRADETKKYPYTLFAASEDKGAISIDAENICINGSLGTNGTVESDKSFNINGKCVEKAEENMVSIGGEMDAEYFSKDVSVISTEYQMTNSNIHINKALSVDGNAEFHGNADVNAAIKTQGNISFTGQNLNANNCVMYTVNGNVDINCGNTSITGLIYAPHGSVSLTADNLSMNSVVVIAQTITLHAGTVNINENQNMAAFVGEAGERSKVEATPTVDDRNKFSAFGEYVKESNSISVEWDEDAADGNHQIFLSEDGDNYTMAAEVADASSYTYAIEQDFELRYVKVAWVKASGARLEAYPFIVEKDGDGYRVSLLDSDGDQLPDIYELVIGSDINDTDTDDDGLTDYQELYLTWTDLNDYDSVQDGVSDADIDTDSDGLTNGVEVFIGTDPQEKDSDGDTVSDGDEKNILGTNPLEADTDSDGLEDPDEGVLGTDPLLRDTDSNGIEDGKEYFQQTVAQEYMDEALFEDNDAVPTEITVYARGNIAKSIIVEEYDGCLKGDERNYVGKVIEISDADINGGEIEFTLSKDYYVESFDTVMGKTNDLLICWNDGEETKPLQTEYDEDKRTLRANVPSQGIYFVLSVSEWLESLGLDMPTEDNPYVTKVNEKTETGISRMRAARSAAKSSISNVEINGQVDIVFVVDTTGSMGSYIQKVKSNINAFANELKDADISPSYALVDYRDITCDTNHPTTVIKNGNKTWFKSVGKFQKALSKLSVGGGGDTPETAVDGLEKARRLKLRKSAQKFIILVTDAGYKINNQYNIKSMEELANQLKKDDITVSVVSNQASKAEYKNLYEKTGGIFANINGNFKDDLLKIADNIEENTNQGYWVCLKGLTTKIVRLDEKPKAKSKADTDCDELKDIKELKSKKPTIKLDINEYVKVLAKGKSPSYKFDYPSAKAYDYNSDPTMQDTDKDGIDDEEEKVIGTYPKIKDSDGDKLNDGKELALWYDPLQKNPDGDRYNDKQEYKKGTDPFQYDKTNKEYAEEFLDGVIRGDFVKDPSVAGLCGQVAGSLVPGVPDARDVIANASRGDWGMSALSGIGLIPVAGDLAKASGKVSKFITKNADKADEVADMVIKLSKNYPDQFAKLIPNGSWKKIAKIFREDDCISKAKYEELWSIAKNADKVSFIKTVTKDFPNAKVVEAVGDVWSDPPFMRGRAIDTLLGNDLGATYKTYDCFDEGSQVATSIKSIDVMAPSYRSKKGLKSRLNRYGNQLMNGKDYVIKNGSRHDIEIKELNIALPDVPLTKGQKKAIDEFIEKNASRFRVRITVVK